MTGDGLTLIDHGGLYCYEVHPKMNHARWVAIERNTHTYHMISGMVDDKCLVCKAKAMEMLSDASL